MLRVAGGEKPYASLKLAYEPVWLKGRESSVRILLKPFEYAPVNAGESVGTAVFFSGEKVIDEVPIQAAEFVEQKHAPVTEEEQNGFFIKIKDFFKKLCVRCRKNAPLAF